MDLPFSILIDKLSMYDIEIFLNCSIIFYIINLNAIEV